MQQHPKAKSESYYALAQEKDRLADEADARSMQMYDVSWGTLSDEQPLFFDHDPWALGSPICKRTRGLK